MRGRREKEREQGKYREETKEKGHSLPGDLTLCRRPSILPPLTPLPWRKKETGRPHQGGKAS